MWPDRVSNPGPLTYESGALPTALRDPAAIQLVGFYDSVLLYKQKSYISVKYIGLLSSVVQQGYIRVAC